MYGQFKNLSSLVVLQVLQCSHPPCSVFVCECYNEVVIKLVNTRYLQTVCFLLGFRLPNSRLGFDLGPDLPSGLGKWEDAALPPSFLLG